MATKVRSHSDAAISLAYISLSETLFANEQARASCWER